ncbi:MAG: tRNA (adenosine(37)-N6)-dimethylallyltransferase MiaA [Acidobacteria bacterium]|nr:tRNA (adenosine(37)-N6)-dimethylallyltransferase MiaA [Acidobacteriota bacterium]
MSNDKSLAPLVVILGPTASGKSTLGVWLAERIGGEIVACDSTQLYKGFDIGTAKPSLAERHGVPHHLIDLLEPTEPATAGGYREAAIAVLDDLRRRNRIPILTVGTGLYLRALLEGLADVPQRSEELRERLRESRDRKPAGHLHRVLRRLDPDAANKIAAADEQKLIRAIEVCLLTKRPLTLVYKEGRSPLEGWRPIKVGLQPQRESLYEKIQARTESMLAHGWLDEVRSLMSRGLADKAKPFDFIGYRELRAVARDEMQLADAKAAIQQATRRYAKRQITWFRREAGVRWLDGFGDSPKIKAAALDSITRSLRPR